MKYQYLVTDPCYIIGRTDWANMCDLATRAEKERDCNWSDEFARLVQKFLRTVSGDMEAVVGNTGYGDWDNSLLECDGMVDVHKSGFVADAGMVCVVGNTPSLEEYVSANVKDETIQSLINGGGIAVVRSGTPLHGYVDESNRNWSVVRILDSDDKVVAESEPMEEY